MWFDSLGLIPVPIPNRLTDVAGFCDVLRIDGIVLTGGNNVSGHVYGHQSFLAEGSSAVRDQTEVALIDFAIAHEVPLVAWCRGLQMMQVYFGGQLCGTEGSRVGHVATVHEVEITTDFHREIAQSSALQVNSYHDYGVRRSELVAPLREFAVEPIDGFVEAAYHPDLPMAACQWHPERPGGPTSFNSALMKSLIPSGEDR